MTRPTNLVGERFDRLLVTGTAEPFIRPNGKVRHRWKCRCDCGSDVEVRGEDLRSGNSRSCGCIQREKARDRFLTHGMTRSAVYRVWSQMKRRCLNPDDASFCKYGARGIMVCDRWQNSFEAFLDDMGPRPEGHSIERIDNNGNYEPSNCRWATTKEQVRNKRNNVWGELNGQRLILEDIARAHGVSSKGVSKVRLRKNVSVEDACKYVQAHQRAR